MKYASLLAIAVLACTACAGDAQREQGRRIGSGLVVEYGLAGPGVGEKVGLLAVSNSGQQLFGSAVQIWGRGGLGTGTFLAATLPKTVRVTWRADTEVGRYWTTGRVIADYLIEVDQRVPEEVIRYANAGRGRALRLLFRIKDDGVLFGWDVEERFGGALVFTMRGGDVPCNDRPRPANAVPNCTTGPLKSAPWYGGDKGFKI